MTPLGDATGRTIDRGASTNLAIIVGLMVWVFGMIAVLTLQDQIGRARAQRAAPPVPGT